MSDGDFIGTATASWTLPEAENVPEIEQ